MGLDGISDTKPCLSKVIVFCHFKNNDNDIGIIIGDFDRQTSSK